MVPAYAPPRGSHACTYATQGTLATLVCSPFVILSEANHVRQKEGGSFLVSMHAENRRGRNLDSWASCLMKILPRFFSRGEKVETSVNKNLAKSGTLRTSGVKSFPSSERIISSILRKRGGHDDLL